MGPRPLVINHQIFFELWRDPLFWECVPSWEADRELADLEVAAASEAKNTLSIQKGDLYNAWVNRIVDPREEEAVFELINFIRNKRNNCLEDLILLTKSGKPVVIAYGERK
jgi:hypothetical protein